MMSFLPIFEKMVELWPKGPEDVMHSLEEFEYMYPFEIPKDLFSLLINAESSGLPPTTRIDAFKRTVVMKYQKYAEGVLNKIPATATCLSLPFLMLSCVVALLIPNLVQMMSLF